MSQKNKKRKRPRTLIAIVIYKSLVVGLLAISSIALLLALKNYQFIFPAGRYCASRTLDGVTSFNTNNIEFYLIDWVNIDMATRDRGFFLGR